LKRYIPWCGTIRVVDGGKLVVDSCRKFESDGFVDHFDFF
jgi:hypothetical protein